LGRIEFWGEYEERIKTGKSSEGISACHGGIEKNARLALGGNGGRRSFVCGTRAKAGDKRKQELEREVKRHGTKKNPVRPRIEGCWWVCRGEFIVFQEMEGAFCVGMGDGGRWFKQPQKGGIITKHDTKKN